MIPSATDAVFMALHKRHIRANGPHEITAVIPGRYTLIQRWREK